MTEDKIKVSRKLLEQVFLDYIMYQGCYLTDKKEEAEKMNPDCYWKPNQNEHFNQTYEEILHILNENRVEK